MIANSLWTRRRVIGAIAVSAAVAPRGLRAQTLPPVKVYKEVTCGCCGLWAQHMSAAGFDVTQVDVPDIDKVKVQLGIPNVLATCHTAEVGNYLIEGHVPAVVVKRLLAQAPAGRGIGVPGMPAGSPGMESPKPVDYWVYLFGPAGISRFARCRETREI